MIKFLVFECPTGATQSFVVLVCNEILIWPPGTRRAQMGLVISWTGWLIIYSLPDYLLYAACPVRQDPPLRRKPIYFLTNFSFSSPINHFWKDMCIQTSKKQITEAHTCSLSLSHTHTHTHARTHARTHAPHTHARTHARTHTHAHAHTHTHTLSWTTQSDFEPESS